MTKHGSASPVVAEATRAVAFYDGSASFAALWPRFREHLNTVIDAGTYSQGIKVGELERALELYTGARHAIAVGSGTDALILLLRAAGIRPGDEVIVPCFTFIASATSVVHAGARPVFVDIDPETYALDPAGVAAAVTPRTKAIMPVHLFAQMADMDALARVSAETGVALIEDSAEAIGMRWNGTHAGLLGLGGVLSFFPTKTLPAIGDGGMILTDDDGVADRARMLRDHGRRSADTGAPSGVSGVAQLAGTNSKMDEIQAAVVLARLERLPEAIARRARLARHYDERLQGVVQTPVIARRDAETNPVFYVYLIEADRKRELVEYLGALGAETEEYYPRPLHLQPCFRELGYELGDFPVAERACGRTIALPLYPDLSIEGVGAVCDAIRDFYGGSAA